MKHFNGSSRGEVRVGVLRGFGVNYRPCRRHRCFRRWIEPRTTDAARFGRVGCCTPVLYAQWSSCRSPLDDDACHAVRHRLPAKPASQRPIPSRRRRQPRDLSLPCGTWRAGPYGGRHRTQDRLRLLPTAPTCGPGRGALDRLSGGGEEGGAPTTASAMALIAMEIAWGCCGRSARACGAGWA